MIDRLRYSTCVGVAFASQSLFIDFATLLWAFDIEPICDDQGNKIMPSLTDVVDGGVTVYVLFIEIPIRIWELTLPAAGRPHFNANSSLVSRILALSWPVVCATPRVPM